MTTTQSSDSVANVSTVSDLTTEHVGWLIKVADPNPLIHKRAFVLHSLRTWIYQGTTTVGLVDPTEAHGRIVGTERHYAPETPCELIELAKKRRRQRAVANQLGIEVVQPAEAALDRWHNR